MATMESLAVYFILNEAREKLGFAPEEFGLSDDDAVTIARMFAKYARTCLPFTLHTGVCCCLVWLAPDRNMLSKPHIHAAAVLL